MDKKRFDELKSKYDSDHRSLTWFEENDILNLNSSLSNIEHLTEEEKYDIVNGKHDDMIKATKDLIKELAENKVSNG